MAAWPPLASTWQSASEVKEERAHGDGGGGGDAQQSSASQTPSHTTSPRFSLSDMPSGQLSESRKHVMKQQSAATHVFLQQRALADGRNAHWGG